MAGAGVFLEMGVVCMVARKIWVCGDKHSEAGVRLRVRDSPREPMQDHAHEDDDHTLHIGLPWVIGLISEYL